MALPAGVPPASFRLEGGRLMYSATAANLKLVSAAGIAPAVPRFQAEHVAATPRAGRPGVRGAHRGLVFMGMRDPHTLNLSPAARFTKLALSMGLAPTLFPQTTGCFSIQLRERNGEKCW